MNKDKIIKDLKERNDKLKNQYQLKEMECLNNQYKADKYKQTIDELTSENIELKNLCDKYEEEHKTTFEQWKKEIEQYQLELDKADSITQSCIFQGKKESEISFRNCLNKMTKYKTTLDKIKEKVNQYELIKGYYDYIEENGYAETTSHDTLKEDILELLEEIE